MRGLTTTLLLAALLALLSACAAPTGGTDLRTASDMTEADRRARLRLELASGYFSRGQPETALDEVKQAIAARPDIAEASVVGRADARWGEIVVAVVAPKDGCSLSAEQVLRLLEGRIARYKHPKEVVFVGQLPKTALGKIRKDDVRRMVAHEAAA